MAKHIDIEINSNTKKIVIHIDYLSPFVTTICIFFIYKLQHNVYNLFYHFFVTFASFNDNFTKLALCNCNKKDILKIGIL